MSANLEVALKETDTTVQERLALKFGAVLAVVGGLGYFAVLLVHGDLPDQTTAVALEHIAGRPEWSLLKLALIVFVLFWVGAFVTLAHSMSRGLSWVLSRLAVAFVMIGATLVLVEYSVLGYGLKRTADAWAVATGPDKETMLLAGRAMLGVTGGLFLNFIAWLIGLPYLLMGLAVARDDGYPTWLGWVAVVAGAGALFAGTTRFLGLELVPFPVLYGGFVIPLTLWLATMGLLMWRRAD